MLRRLFCSCLLIALCLPRPLHAQDSPPPSEPYRTAQGDELLLPPGWLLVDAYGRAVGGNSPAALNAGSEIAPSMVQLALLPLPDEMLPLRPGPAEDAVTLLGRLLPQFLQRGDPIAYSPAQAQTIAGQAAAYAYASDPYTDSLLLLISRPAGDYLLLVGISPLGEIDHNTALLFAIADTLRFRP